MGSVPSVGEVGDLTQGHSFTAGQTVTLTPEINFACLSKRQHKSAVLVGIVPCPSRRYGEVNDDIVVRPNAAILNVDDDGRLLTSQTGMDTDVIASQRSNAQSTPNTRRPPTPISGFDPVQSRCGAERVDDPWFRHMRMEYSSEYFFQTKKPFCDYFTRQLQ